MTNNMYNDFFNEISKIIQKQSTQKARGLNDYNVFTSLLSYHDEVRLHSRFLASLLDPLGTHYQNDLFLVEFIETLGIKDFGLNTQIASVYKEYANIDIYITDGSKHIIIENKIYAGDQEHQIKRYIETVQSENGEISGEDIYVIFLSPNRPQPSGDSLEKFEIIENSFLRYTDSSHNLAQLQKIPYRSIHYREEIMQWLESILKEVENLTNLNVVISQYKEVVQRLYNSYKGKVVSIQEAFNSNDPEKNHENYKLAKEVFREYPKLRQKTVYDFFETCVSTLQNELGDEWIVKKEGNLVSKYGFPFRVYKKSWENENKKFLLIGYEFDKSDYYNGYVGVVKFSDKVDLDEIRQQFSESLQRVSENIQLSDNQSWWLNYEWLPYSDSDVDFVEKVLFEGFTPDRFIGKVKKIIDVFEGENDLLGQINKFLQDS